MKICIEIITDGQAEHAVKVTPRPVKTEKPLDIPEPGERITYRGRTYVILGMEQGGVLAEVAGKDGRMSEHHMTNGMKIRLMSDEELANFAEENCGCHPAASRDTCRGVSNCSDCWLEWLKQEASE